VGIPWRKAIAAEAVDYWMKVTTTGGSAATEQCSSWSSYQGDLVDGLLQTTEVRAKGIRR
jgi:hypothetical protein